MTILPYAGLRMSERCQNHGLLPFCNICQPDVQSWYWRKVFAQTGLGRRRCVMLRMGCAWITHGLRMILYVFGRAHDLIFFLPDFSICWLFGHPVNLQTLSLLQQLWLLVNDLRSWDSRAYVNKNKSNRHQQSNLPLLSGDHISNVLLSCACSNPYVLWKRHLVWPYARYTRTCAKGIHAWMRVPYAHMEKASLCSTRYLCRVLRFFSVPGIRRVYAG